MIRFEPKNSRDITLFGGVKVGEVFMHDNRIFLAIERGAVLQDESCNAVDITNGELAHIHDASQVEMLNVIIKEI